MMLGIDASERTENVASVDVRLPAYPLHPGDELVEVAPGVSVVPHDVTAVACGDGKVVVMLQNQQSVSFPGEEKDRRRAAERLNKAKAGVRFRTVEVGGVEHEVEVGAGRVTGMFWATIAELGPLSASGTSLEDAVENLRRGAEEVVRARGGGGEP